MEIPAAKSYFNTKRTMKNQIGQLAKQFIGRLQDILHNNIEINPNEQVKDISTRSEFKFSEIIMKRQISTKEMKSIVQLNQPEKRKKNENDKSSTLPTKNPAVIKVYVALVPLPLRLSKRKIDKKKLS